MKLPGPPALPIIGNSHQFTTNDLCKFEKEFKEFARSYAPITRFWFGHLLVVVLTDPDNIENVVKHDKFCCKGYISRNSTEQPFRNGLFHVDGEEWRRHRNIVSSAFHINILETFIQNFTKHSDILANKLKDLADGITAHDIAPYFTRCTLDIIYQTSSRINTNAQTGNDNSTMNNIKTILDTLALRFLKPWLFIDCIFNATELGKKYNKASQCEHGKIINEIAKKRRTRETTHTRGLNDEKLSIMDLLISMGTSAKRKLLEKYLPL